MKKKQESYQDKLNKASTPVTPLERRLTRQLFAAEVYAQLYHAKLKGHTGVRYKAMLTKLGPLKAAKQLLKSKKKINVSKWKKNSIEYLVVQKRFRTLFNEKQIKRARKGLAK